MKHIYTLVLTLLIYTTATGQGVTPLGQIRGTTEALGGFINDSDWHRADRADRAGYFPAMKIKLIQLLKEAK